MEDERPSGAKQAADSSTRSAKAEGGGGGEDASLAPSEMSAAHMLAGLSRSPSKEGEKGVKEEQENGAQ